MRVPGSLLVLVVLFSIQAGAQDVDKLPEHPTVPAVRFECVWEAATPQDFVVVVNSLGSAKYLSRNPTRQNEDGSNSLDLSDYNIDFTLSPANQTRVFQLALQANYFNGDFEYKKHAVASTGTKTLGYADSSRHFETTYNWSENTAIDQLTSIFEGISSTLEHGRRLSFLRRFDKLGLEDELKGMEDAAEKHYLAEIQAIAPILENIAADSSVLNIARRRARRLLDLAGKEAGQHAGVKTPQ